MQLRRIEIRDFKKLGHAVIDDIGDGVCVIVGDNEAGKSTVLAALRAVLFERHRGSGAHIEAMLPYGQSVRPQISIAFDLGGTRWRLRKAFHQRPEAELEGGGERLCGDAAEDRLADLLRFTPPGRGASKPADHQGLYGLLWVEQGQAHLDLGVGQGGRSSLASAIEGEVGQVVGGERGRVLLAAAAQRRDEFWSRNDKPRKTYKEAIDKLEALRQHAETVRLALQSFEGKIDALADRTEALARHQRDDRVNRAEAAVAEQRRTVERAASFEAAHARAVRAVDAARRDQTIAAERRHRRHEMIGRVDGALREQDDAQRLGADARMLLVRQQAAADAAERRAGAAHEVRSAAERRMRDIEQALALRRRQDALDRSAALLLEAETQAARRREIAGLVAGISVSATDTAELDRLQGAVERARSAFAAASVRIEFAPDGPRDIELDGAPVEAGGSVSLSRDATLTLQGFGRLRIRPGGGVDELACAAEAAERRRDARLAELGLPSVAEAKVQAARRHDAEREIAGLDHLLSALVPGGLDALRQAVENERNGLMHPLPDSIAACLDADDAMFETARRARDAAATDEMSARTSADVSRNAREQAARDLAIWEDRAARARMQHEAASSELVAARAQEPDETLREQLAEAVAAVAGGETDLARAGADLGGLDAVTARLDLERAVGAERSIRADLDRLTVEKRDLEIELGALGQNGLGEELSHLNGQVERLERDKEAQDLEARASRLLFETLAEAQRDSKERWLEPVRQRVKPYLKFLEPDSDIVLNERTLEIEGIKRNGIDEPFQSLSMGAREQMAVITRLALADILRGAGHPSALILDDALVNTDEGRLERMHRVLQTAAKTHQVLVLTCRERDFCGLGDVKRL